MHIEPAVFADVPLYSNEPHECSPAEPPPDWRGVTIRAPNRVSFERGEVAGPYGSFAAIPICGFFVVDAQLQGADEPMQLIAVDQQSGKRYSGAIVELDPSPEVPPPDHEPVPAEEYADLAGGGYFNVNLPDYVDLPVQSAVYRVHIEFRNHQSNVVLIELVLEP
jgi:hypothetical protein